MTGEKHIQEFISGNPGYEDFKNASVLFNEADERPGSGCKLVRADGNPFYLKFVRNDSEFDFTNQLLEWLSVRKIPASPPYVRLHDFHPGNETLRAYIRPLFMPAAVPPSPSEIPVILSALRPLHDALADFPRQKESKGKFELVQSQLEMIRTAYLDGEVYDEKFGLSSAYRNWLRENAEWMDGHYQQYDLDFFVSEDSQCLHGDLHPRNMLYASGEGLMFIDFDDSYKSFSSPLYDLAYVYARLAEPTGISADAFAESVRSLYGKEYSGETIRNWSKQIFTRQILMVMYNALFRKKEKTTAEFEKFKYRIDCYENGTTPSIAATP